MGEAAILIAVEGTPPGALIERVGEVPTAFWSRLRVELGVEFSPASERRLAVPLNRFLANRTVVGLLCQQFGVKVTASDEATAILSRLNREAERLQSLRNQAHPLSADELTQRLKESRVVRQLRDFQERDLRKLLGLPHGSNFSVPGAGKTFVTLAIYEAERVAGRVDRLLVVAPLSAFQSWTQEVEESLGGVVTPSVFVPGELIRDAAEILLVNYEKLPGNFEAIVNWASRHKSHVVLDEAHRIKRGRTGAWGRAALDLAWYAERRDVLTGTPAPQHPSDLEALLNFVWPSQGRTLLPRVAFQRQPPPDAGRSVASAIRPLFVRTRKSELGLEKPVMRVLRVDLHGLHRDIYSAVINQYSGTFSILRRDRANLARMRQVTMYLLEAATNPSLLPVGSDSDDPIVFQHSPMDVPAESDLGHLIAQYGRYETPAKFRKLGELVRENAELGRKTLVWSYFVRNLELLKRDLARYQPAMVHGGVPSETSKPNANPTREEEITRFRSDPECLVLLANPAAMAEGISLHHTCHDAIYLERTFNAGQYLQSVDRIHRLGLDPGTETRITFLVTTSTIDEAVYRRVEEKAARLGEMLDDEDIVTMSLPDEDDLEDIDTGLGQAIDSAEDVEALFRHLRGEDPQASEAP